MSTAIVSNELDHHMFPVVRYAQIGGGAAGPTAVAGSDGPVRDSMLALLVQEAVSSCCFQGAARRRAGAASV